MKTKGRLAGEQPVLMIKDSTSTETNPATLQQMQSLSMGSLASHSERTPYSPFGQYPVSDGLVDFGEPQSTYR